MTEKDNYHNQKKKVVYTEKAWKRILNPANIFNNELNRFV